MTISNSNNKAFLKTVKKSKILLRVSSTIGKRLNSDKNFKLISFKKPSLSPNVTHKQKYSSNNFLLNKSKSKFTVALTSNSSRSNPSTNPKKTKEIESMTLKYLNISKSE